MENKLKSNKSNGNNIEEPMDEFDSELDLEREKEDLEAWKLQQKAAKGF
ncbi:Uncharacterised protein [uncultured archaeon]|nr:Uncharacterised protein [uncultured archaeon]